jgi:hypothetical protein
VSAHWNWRRPQARFAGTLVLALLAFAAQVLRFEYRLIGTETIHAVVIISLALAWLVALAATFHADLRWGFAAAFTAPLALVFLFGLLAGAVVCTVTEAACDL